MNIAFKIWVLCHFFCFSQNGFMASCLKNAALMESQRTEITAAKTASVAGQTELDLFQCRNPSVFFIHGMILACVRQVINIIHFHLCQRLRRRILDHIAAVSIRFHQRLCSEWIRVAILDGKTVRISFFV